MVELKTKLTDASVTDYLNAIENDQVRQDCFTILEVMQEATKAKPQMWGDSIVGFGTYHYVGASGREGDWPLTGFSPRKQNLTLYIMTGFEQYEELLSRLGKFTTGKACLYIKRLSDVDIPTLRELIQASVDYMIRTYKIVQS
ncbi:MAG: hypothetical protein A2029_06390 [Chloroflexi bacterium RBG_19FT_COMBO_47_9]|nr:MAG: hypothetical protein A2029_06390 [Chloroflexi bacterium RBG_19FT_COMBO_47_9]